MVLPSETSWARASDKNGVVWRAERVCGVNCVYFLLRHRDISASYKEVSQSLLQNDTLPSLTDIKKVSQSYGLQLKIGTTTPEGLTAVAFPVIVHLDIVGARGEQGGHFSVVLDCDSEGVKMLDGTSVEVRNMPWRDFNRMWSGYLLYADQDSRFFTVISWQEGTIAILGGCLCGLVVDGSLFRYLSRLNTKKTFGRTGE